MASRAALAGKADMLRIIDNKRIALTDSEFALYQEICRSYDGPKFKGEELFKDLFETDKHGIIVFLRPPNKSHTSMEVFMFLVSVMIHQHLGTACAEVHNLISENKSLLKQVADLPNKVAELEEKIKYLESKLPKVKRDFKGASSDSGPSANLIQKRIKDRDQNSG